jgi:hypothetical protein
MEHTHYASTDFGTVGTFVHERTEVFCTTRFEAIHCWPSCPIEEVAYLRDPHRHVFHIKAYKRVTHGDRDVEFIWLKHQIEKYIRDTYEFSEVYNCIYLGPASCEMIASNIANQFDLSQCECSEDGENGAVVFRHPIAQ